jgi:hypothetical protein
VNRRQETGENTPLYITEGCYGGVEIQDTLSTEDLEQFIQTLNDVVKKNKSLIELENWLTSLPYVQSVKTQEYLVKVHPPLKELVVTFKMNDESTITKVIDVVVHQDQSLSFERVHDNQATKNPS